MQSPRPKFFPFRLLYKDMLHYHLLFFIAALAVLADPYRPTCNEKYYGRPSLESCSYLLGLEINNPSERYFSVPVVGIKPPDVSDGAWARRVLLPIVKSHAECNIAFLSLRQLDGSYTDSVASYHAMSQTEIFPRRSPMQGGILDKCVGGLPRPRGGGFRLLREWTLSRSKL